MKSLKPIVRAGNPADVFGGATLYICQTNPENLGLKGDLEAVRVAKLDKT